MPLEDSNGVFCVCLPHFDEMIGRASQEKIACLTEFDMPDCLNVTFVLGKLHLGSKAPELDDVVSSCS